MTEPTSPARAKLLAWAGVLVCLTGYGADCGTPDDTLRPLPAPRDSGPRPFFDAGPPPPPLDAGPPLDPSLSCDELFGLAGGGTAFVGPSTPCNAPSMPLLGLRAEAIDPYTGDVPPRACWRVRRAWVDTGWRAGAMFDGAGVFSYTTLGMGPLEWSVRFVDASGRLASGSFEAPFRSTPAVLDTVTDDVRWVFGRYREVGYATRTEIVHTGGRIPGTIEAVAGSTEVLLSWLEPDRARVLYHMAPVDVPVPAGGTPMLAMGRHLCPEVWLVAGHGRALAIARITCDGAEPGTVEPAGSLMLAADPDQIAVIGNLAVVRTGTAIEAFSLPGGESVPIGTGLGPVVELAGDFVVRETDVLPLVLDDFVLSGGAPLPLPAGVRARAGTLRTAMQFSGGYLLVGENAVVAATNHAGPNLALASEVFGGPILAATETIGPGGEALVYAIGGLTEVSLFWSDEYYEGCD